VGTGNFLIKYYNGQTK